MDFRQSIVGIVAKPSSELRFAGTGFIVSDGLILTCAHIIDEAQKSDNTVRFRIEGRKQFFPAQIVFINPQFDICILKPDFLPADILPLQLMRSGQSKGNRFSVFGYPQQGGFPGLNGTGWVLGTGLDQQNREILQLSSHQVTQGCSGGPVWDDELEAVVGMVGRSPNFDLDKNLGGESFAIPSEVLQIAYPALTVVPARRRPQPPPPTSSGPAGAFPNIIQSILRKFLDRPTTSGTKASPASPPDVQTDTSEAAELPGKPSPKKNRRVLNANFASVEDDQVLWPSEFLYPGKEYNLLADVGLPWDKIPSLLRGEASFPEDVEVSYLSTEDREKGWFDVEVVFVSQDFQPHLISERMRVPVDSLERSTPYIGDQLADTPGPVKLTVQAPNLSSETDSLRARGRLCLYYGAQVLQSAVVEVEVRFKASEQQTLGNFAAVDYILTPGFESVGKDLSQRRRFGKDGVVVETSVKIGLLINEDLSGTHRLLLKVDDETEESPSLPPAWKAYDATAIGEKLKQVREILIYPSWNEPVKHDSGFLALNKFNEDLVALARVGSGLYSIMMQGITPAGNVSPLLWRKNFRKALHFGDIIQLARAGSVPSTHIIPWSLVYDYPFEPDRSDFPIKVCRIVDEQWDHKANRKAQFLNQKQSACPYEHEHAVNVVCPFGFWGYKYTLEQPISALTDKGWDIKPAKQVTASTPVKMAIAATKDGPWEDLRKLHFQAIRQAVNADYIPTEPAGERDQVRDSLNSPELVYILCHGGKKDALTYLSIGPNDGDAIHTITPELPGYWGENDYIDLKQWERIRPLVFINGCYTTDLLPELTLDFVSAFRDLMAGGVIGTEIEVSVKHGHKAAELFFDSFSHGADVGNAMLDMRWQLLNEGSFLGLAYTCYAMADLHLQRMS